MKLKQDEKLKSANAQRNTYMTKRLLLQIKLKKTRNATYNVTYRRVGLTTVAVEKYCIFWVRVCSHNYPSCNFSCSVLYRHLWPVWLYHIFPHYLTNGTIFGGKEKLFNLKCVFWFSLQLCLNIFFILRSIKRYIIINVHKSSCKVPVILVTF
jgi:hypothetical protein